LRIIGIDLAAEPKGTAMTIIDWSPGSVRVVDVQLGVSDQQIIAKIDQAEKIGIDCALGWPVEFIEFLNGHLELNKGEVINGDLEWRRRVSYRESDRHVREITGRWPLSVATDRLGMTALRCAGLLSKLQETGVEVDRSGSGLVVEVYPAASLRIWGFDTKGYRDSASRRAELLDELRARAPYLDLGDFREKLVESCDSFDSLFAGISARAAALGFTYPPNPEQFEAAKLEGWVALPNAELRKLSL